MSVVYQIQTRRIHISMLYKHGSYQACRHWWCHCLHAAEGFLRPTTRRHITWTHRHQQETVNVGQHTGPTKTSALRDNMPAIWYTTILMKLEIFNKSTHKQNKQNSINRYEAMMTSPGPELDWMSPAFFRVSGKPINVRSTQERRSHWQMHFPTADDSAWRPTSHLHDILHIDTHTTPLTNEYHYQAQCYNHSITTVPDARAWMDSSQ